MKQIALEKQQLRQKMTSLRNSLSNSVRLDHSQAACQQLMRLTKEQEYQSVFVYIPFRSELDIWSYIEWCWRSGIEVLVPRCHVDTYTMTLYPLYNKDQLRKGAYGILEPDPHQLQPTDAVPQAVLVPGLAFNHKGQRIGYGGGYYDRYYKKIKAASQWIGVAFEEQLVEDIPVEEYDIILNFVVTNKGIMRFS